MRKGNMKARVLACLPSCMPKAAETAQVGRITVYRWINRAHEAGEVYISGWRRNKGGGMFVAIYSVGNFPDVPCTLKPIPNTITCRKYRKRMRQSGDWAHRLARLRAVYWAERAKKKPNSWIAALEIRA